MPIHSPDLRGKRTALHNVKGEVDRKKKKRRTLSGPEAMNFKNEVGRIRHEG